MVQQIYKDRQSRYVQQRIFRKKATSISWDNFFNNDGTPQT